MRGYMKFLLLLSVALILCGCSRHKVVGNGKLASKSLSLPHFNRVRIVGNFIVKIRQTTKQTVAIRADSNIIPLVKLKVTQGFLTISHDPNVVFTSKHPIEINLAARQLNQVDSSGANDIWLSDINGERLIINMRGAGMATLSGNVTDLDINISGTAEVQAKHMQTRESEVNIFGAGRASVFAAKELIVTISGIGHVVYFGSPDVIKPTISGKGSVEPGQCWRGKCEKLD